MSWRNEGMNEHTPYSLEPFTSGRTQSLPLQTSGIKKGIYPYPLIFQSVCPQRAVR